MSEYKVTHDQMTQVADAIRAKGGTTDPLVWPTGFSAAVEGIQAGGGGDAEAMLANLIGGTDTDVIVPNGVTQVRSYVFQTSPVKSVFLPDSVTSIGKYAFCECRSLTSVRMSPNVDSIQQSAFKYCTLLEEIELPESLTTITSDAFRYSGLQSIVIPQNIVSISGYAFSTTDLKTVTFRGTPTTIPTTVFNSCSYLTTINVPWAEGAVSGAPWGATKATINYNYTGG